MYTYIFLEQNLAKVLHYDLTVTDLRRGDQTFKKTETDTLVLVKP